MSRCISNPAGSLRLAFRFRAHLLSLLFKIYYAPLVVLYERVVLEGCRRIWRRINSSYTHNYYLHYRQNFQCESIIILWMKPIERTYIYNFLKNYYTRNLLYNNLFCNSIFVSFSSLLYTSFLDVNREYLKRIETNNGNYHEKTKSEIKAEMREAYLIVIGSMI